MLYATRSRGAIGQTTRCSEARLDLVKWASSREAMREAARRVVRECEGARRPGIAAAAAGMRFAVLKREFIRERETRHGFHGSTMPADLSASVGDAPESDSSQVMAHSALPPALLLGRPPPEITLPPAKQDFVNGIEILCNGTLLLRKFLNLDILLVEPATAKYELFVPSFPRHVFALFVDVKVVFFLVWDEDRLAPTTYAHNRDGKR
jgi:hypothetical protein